MRSVLTVLTVLPLPESSVGRVETGIKFVTTWTGWTGSALEEVVFKSVMVKIFLDSVKGSHYLVDVITGDSGDDPTI